MNNPPPAGQPQPPPGSIPLHHPGPGRHPYLTYPHPLPVPPVVHLNVNVPSWQLGTRAYFCGAFLLRRDWKDGNLHILADELQSHWHHLQGVRLTEVKSLMVRLASRFRQQLVDNITDVVLEWLRRRPLGLWWLCQSLSTWPDNPESHLPATWHIWFSETVTQAQFTAGFIGTNEQRAFVDFHAWCLRPVNVVRIWSHAIGYLEPGLVTNWVNGGPQPLPLLLALRAVTANMLKPTFQHAMQNIFCQHSMHRYGYGGTIMRHLYHQDDMTAGHHGDLVPANVNPDVGRYQASARRLAWIDGLDNEF